MLNHCLIQSSPAGPGLVLPQRPTGPLEEALKDQCFSPRGVFKVRRSCFQMMWLVGTQQIRQVRRGQLWRGLWWGPEPCPQAFLSPTVAPDQRGLSPGPCAANWALFGCSVCSDCSDLCSDWSVVTLNRWSKNESLVVKNLPAMQETQV